MQPWWAHLLLTTFTIPGLAWWEQNSAFLLQSSTPYDGFLLQPWWTHLLLTMSTMPGLACWEQNSAFLLPSSTPNVDHLVHSA